MVVTVSLVKVINAFLLFMALGLFIVGPMYVVATQWRLLLFFAAVALAAVPLGQGAAILVGAVLRSRPKSGHARAYAAKRSAERRERAVQSELGSSYFVTQRATRAAGRVAERAEWQTVYTERAAGKAGRRRAELEAEAKIADRMASARAAAEARVTP